MAHRASLAYRFMLVHERTALLRVTLEARFISAEECKAAAFKPLLDVRRGALGGDPLVRFMAIAAAHLAFKHRMVMRQGERSANFQMTLETGVGRLPRIDDRACSSASFDVQAPGSVARLATHVLCVVALRLQTRMSSRPEVAHDLLMAGRAFLRADELRSRDAGRGNNCSARRTARKQNYGQRNSSPGAPQKAFAPSVDPSS